MPNYCETRFTRFLASNDQHQNVISSPSRTGESWREAPYTSDDEVFIFKPTIKRNSQFNLQDKKVAAL
jgi:hypothetical protein